MYDSGNYDFYYVGMVTSNATANSYIHNVYNLHWVPSVYVDGGYITAVGATSSEAYYEGLIEDARDREAHDLHFELTFIWLAGAQMRIIYTLYSHELTNDAPGIPSTPGGPSEAQTNNELIFSTSVVEPDGDQVWYRWAFGDDDTSAWVGPYDSEAPAEINHTYTEVGTFDVTVSAKDKFDAVSDWSPALTVTTFDYVCGDADGNQLINISDAVYLIAYIFGGGPAPDPLLAGDADCNTLVNISDAVYLIAYIFGGGPAPCATCP